MVSMGFTGVGLKAAGASLEASAETREMPVESGESLFGSLLANTVELDEQDVHALLGQSVLLVDARGHALPPGSTLPEGGKVLPQLQQSMLGQRAVLAVAVGEELDIDELGRLEHMVKSIGERTARSTRGGQNAPEQLALPLNQQTASPRPTSTTPPAMPAPPLTPGQPGFEQALGQRLVVMVQQGVQHARVSIHPEHLGPMEIRMKIDGEGAHLSLQSPHAPVREALEQALPRLRDMLADGGLELVDVDVGDSGQQADERAADETAARPEPGPGDEVAGEEAAQPTLVSQGLIDTFA